MNILHAQQKEFKITVLFIVAMSAIFVAINIGAAIRDPDHLGLPVVNIVIFGIISIGLFSLNSTARTLAQFVLAIGVFTAIVGYINPFYASDMMAAGIEPPPGW